VARPTPAPPGVRSARAFASKRTGCFWPILLKKSAEVGLCPDSVLLLMEGWVMMSERQVRQEALFYGFSLEDHVPSDHLLRMVDRFVDLGSIRRHLEPCYSATGRPSVAPS
jgi:hypothetical protein